MVGAAQLLIATFAQQEKGNGESGRVT